MGAMLPPTETDRLQSLHRYDILDTPPEVAFDRLTSLASRIFDVPISMISFVDTNRQWLKSCYGTKAWETDRTQSFCAMAIQSDHVMVVPDARADARFCDNQQVIGHPGIRFYAGAPMITPSGHRLGSFCILDMTPREMSPEQEKVLVDLAAMAVDELELRRSVRDFCSQEKSLREVLRQNSELAAAVRNVKSGVIMTDARQRGNPIVYANAGFLEITKFPMEDVLGRNCRFLQGPGTEPEKVDQIRQAIAKRETFYGTITNYRHDGTEFINELIISPVFDENGDLISFVGLQNDVTEREKARVLLEQRVLERTEALANSQIEILSRLARAAEYRDDDTGQHTHRVGNTSKLIAEALGLSPETVGLIQQAAPLHDVGKIGISDLILLKPGRLTDEEFTIMRSHAAIGAKMLADGHSEVVQMAERIARSHHEKWDGTGYPQQLAGNSIPIEARILAVADVFDALTHDRPYKVAWSVADAVAEIGRLSGRHFDPQVVAAFMTLPHEQLT